MDFTFPSMLSMYFFVGLYVAEAIVVQLGRVDVAADRFSRKMLAQTQRDARSEWSELSTGT